MMTKLYILFGVVCCLFLAMVNFFGFTLGQALSANTWKASGPSAYHK